MNILKIFHSLRDVPVVYPCDGFCGWGYVPVTASVEGVSTCDGLVLDLSGIWGRIFNSFVLADLPSICGHTCDGFVLADLRSICGRICDGLWGGGGDVPVTISYLQILHSIWDVSLMISYSQISYLWTYLWWSCTRRYSQYLWLYLRRSHTRRSCTVFGDAPVIISYSQIFPYWWI